MNIIKKAVKSIIKIVDKIETGILVFLLILIMFISLIQIILRSYSINFGYIIFITKNSNIIAGKLISNIFYFLQIIIIAMKEKVVWFDPIIQYSVLWIGLISASLAVNDNKHINIDIAGKLAKGRLKFFVISITNLFTSVFCFIISVSSLLYIVNIEVKFNQTPFFNVPRWILLLILPIGFGMTGLKFLLISIKNLYYLIINKKECIKAS